MQTVSSFEKLASRHYENFPVALWILPAAWRKTIRLIYAFARQADDIADEGDLKPHQRLDALNAFVEQLRLIETGITQPANSTALSPFFQALDGCIRDQQLPLAPFFDLLTAFKQDVVKSNYDNWDELLQYCAHSANPIGLLLLTLAKQNTTDNIKASHAICTALQLLNFWQDVIEDQQQRARCYIPTDAQHAHGLTTESLLDTHHAAAYRHLIQAQLDKTALLLDSGATLPNHLSGVFGFQIRLVVVCAYRVLYLLRTRHNYYERPVLKTTDWFRIIGTAGYQTVKHWFQKKCP